MEVSHLSIYFLSIVSVVIGIIAWVSLKRVKKISAEVRELRQEMIDVRATTRASFKELQRKITSANGNSAVTPDMTIGEILALHPRSQSVLSMFHLGACSSCAITDDHLLGDAIREYGVDGESLIMELNRLLEPETM